MTNPINHNPAHVEMHALNAPPVESLVGEVVMFNGEPHRITGFRVFAPEELRTHMGFPPPDVLHESPRCGGLSRASADRVAEGLRRFFGTPSIYARGDRS